MDVFLVITQGIGLALACGVRPFLPLLLAGSLAYYDSGLNFNGTDFVFMEDPIWLLAVLVVAAAALGYERSHPGVFDTGRLGAAMAGVSIGCGALLFAGSLADEGHPAWPGLVGGILCAALANAATRNFFIRVAQRLDADARAALAVYKDAIAFAVALLAVLLPPTSLIFLAGLVVLLLRGRRRDDEKYAGLRILR